MTTNSCYIHQNVTLIDKRGRPWKIEKFKCNEITKNDGITTIDLGKKELDVSVYRNDLKKVDDESYTSLFGEFVEESLEKIVKQNLSPLESFLARIEVSRNIELINNPY